MMLLNAKNCLVFSPLELLCGALVFISKQQMSAGEQLTDALMTKQSKQQMSADEQLTDALMTKQSKQQMSADGQLTDASMTKQITAIVSFESHILVQYVKQLLKIQASHIYGSLNVSWQSQGWNKIEILHIHIMLAENLKHCGGDITVSFVFSGQKENVSLQLMQMVLVTSQTKGHQSLICHFQRCQW